MFAVAAKEGRRTADFQQYFLLPTAEPMVPRRSSGAPAAGPPLFAAAVVLTLLTTTSGTCTVQTILSQYVLRQPEYTLLLLVCVLEACKNLIVNVSGNCPASFHFLLFPLFSFTALVEFIGPENVELTTNETTSFEIEASSTLVNGNLTFTLVPGSKSVVTYTLSDSAA